MSGTPRISVGAEGTPAASLRQLAGPRLYQRNAFRMTGLLTGAGNREVRDRRQRVLPALEVGAPVSVGPDGEPPESVSLAQARQAFAELADPRQRIVHELFWLWGEDGAGDEGGCGCPGSLHADHDAAVRAHAHALDLEPATDSDVEEVDALWLAAASLWRDLPRGAAFWAHLRHRIGRLDDRRLDESSVDGLREELPKALVRTVVELAAAEENITQVARLAGQARRWDLDGAPAEQMLAQAAEPSLRRIDELATRCGQKIDDGKPLEAGNELVRAAAGELARLRVLVPSQRQRSLSLRSNKVAVLLNNAALELAERPGSAPKDVIRGFYDTAATLAHRPETKLTIARNQGLLEQPSRPTSPRPSSPYPSSPASGTATPKAPAPAKVRKQASLGSFWTFPAFALLFAGIFNLGDPTHPWWAKFTLLLGSMMLAHLVAGTVRAARMVSANAADGPSLTVAGVLWLVLPVEAFWLYGFWPGVGASVVWVFFALTAWAAATGWTNPPAR